MSNYNHEILNFNDTWGFYRNDLNGAEKIDFDDSKFVNVTIPHTMRLEKNPAGGVKDVFQGIGWYRRYFTLDSKYNGKQIKVDFEGVMIDCEVFLNGEKLCEHNGGYMGFSVDITNKIKFNETNVLAVRVSSLDNPNTPPGKPLSDVDFHYYGGIYRNVYLRITDNLFITDAVEANEVASGGVFVTYPEVSNEKAIINVKTHINNSNEFDVNATVKTQIVDENDSVVARTESTERLTENSAKSFVHTLEVINPKLWHPDAPNLYKVVSEVYNNEKLTDAVNTMIGIRRIDMKPDGFYINGEKLFLRGANRHQCYAYIGDAAPDSMQIRDAMQLKENGFNSVRAAHYPQSPAFLDACDKLGLLVIECQPGWQIFTETETFYNYTIRDCREMIRRDRNHPSVFMWETSLNETHYSAEWAKDVTKTAHEEYPNDQMFTAADYGLQGEYYDVNYKTIDGDVDHNPEKTVFTREWGDMGGYRQWRRKDGEYFMLWQTETHQRFLNGGGYPDWGGMDAGERLAGYFMWSWNDYARGYNNNMLPSGCVEIDRTEKYLAYYLQSMLPSSKKPMVFIANRNNFISGRCVRVFSNCDTVKLYQNNTLIGELSRNDVGLELMDEPVKPNDKIGKYLKKRKAGNFVSFVPHILKKGGSPIFNFCLPYLKRGTLTAKAFVDGKEVASHIVRMPKTAKSIEIIPYTRGIIPVADGSDLIPVYFKVVDANGTLITDYRNEIHISVSGEGELVGYSVDRIKAEHQKPNAGVAFAFIRTTKNAGKIKITANSRNLNGEAVIETAEYSGQFVPNCEHKSWIGGVEKLENIKNDNNKNSNSKVAKKLTAKDIKTVIASCENEVNRGTDKLFDGETLIATGWLAKTNELPQSVTVEFKKPQDLTACSIYWEKDSSWYTYDLEVSENGDEWKNVFDKKEVGGQTIQAQTFSKCYENVKFTRITIRNVVSSSGTSRTGIAEIIFYTK